MLARPGIVVSIHCNALDVRSLMLFPRLPLVFVMEFRPAARSRLASTACTRGLYIYRSANRIHVDILLPHSGAATTASRLGQPDLAIATLNDFVQSAQMVCSLDPTMPVIADADTG